MSDLVLYPGCVIPARLPFIESAVRFIIDKLNIRMDDMQDTTCCMEPVGLRSLSEDGWFGVASRLHSIADGKDIVTLCDGCSVSLSECSQRLKDQKGKDEAKDVLEKIDRQVAVSEVKGFIEILYENLESIKKNVVKKQDLKLAVFPGCHCEAVCSKKGLSANSMMFEIVKATGAMPKYPRANLCCGGSVSMIDDTLSKAILGESVNSFKATGADGVVTSCPFCFMQFDMVARYRTYHIAEIVAMAMGWEVDITKFHRGQ